LFWAKLNIENNNATFKFEQLKFLILTNHLARIYDFRSMKSRRLSISIFFSFLMLLCKAQKVDSIYFHLYTDSLKKGTHNYINVDGKLSNGKWMPLTNKEIIFSTTYGTFEGNELVLPLNVTEEKVTVKAILRDKQSTWKEITIWIKKKPDNEILPTKDEILNNKSKKSKTNPKK
jgi:hypothetical protein